MYTTLFRFSADKGKHHSTSDRDFPPAAMWLLQFSPCFSQLQLTYLRSWFPRDSGCFIKSHLLYVDVLICSKTAHGGHCPGRREVAHGPWIQAGISTRIYTT